MNTEIATVSENQPFSLAPQSLDQAIQFSNQMAACGLLPAHLKDSPGNCLRLVMQASEWGMNPFGVADATSVIHGKLMYEGKLTAAVINAKGGLSKRLNYIFDGEGSNRTLKVTGTIRGEDEAREVDLTYSQACKINQNGQMQKNPDQQMCYIGARIWGRRHMPELMLGVYGDDEFSKEGNPDESPEPKAERPAPPKKSKGAAAAVSEMKQAEAEVVESEVADTEVVEDEPKTPTKKAAKQASKKAEKKEPEAKAKAEPETKKEPAKEEAKKPEPKKEKAEPLTELSAGQAIKGNFAVISTRGAVDGQKNPIRILEIKGDEFVGTAYSRDPENPHVIDEGVAYFEVSGFELPSGKVLPMIDTAKEAEEEVHF